MPQGSVPPAGPTCLGVVKHPALGIRLPELFLPGILQACLQRRVAPGLMLSFGRETAPEPVIAAPPGTWEITRGHTGTSIREYQSQAAAAATQVGLPVEVEADHLIIIGSATAAVQRIAGYHEHTHISEEQLQASLAYNRGAIDEAAEVGVVGCFTTDTSDLFWPEADQLSAAEVRRLFASRFASPQAEALLSRYASPTHLRGPDGRSVSVTISPLQTMRLALKFCRSLQINAEIYRYCKRKLGRRPFSFEISLDETSELTHPRETLFYLTEWRARGLPCHYFAPNIGLAKRADFQGDLAELQARVRRHHAIAQHVCGALLSIHSGSGTTPHSGKGRGTYDAILAGTGGQVKYKISGVYYELLVEQLARQPKGSDARRLYERIFDEVHGLLVREIRHTGPLAQPLLIRQVQAYERAVKRNPARKRDPRADFFRFHSYLALNLRDAAGQRYLRQAILELVRCDQKLRTALDQEVRALTLRLIDGLHFENNLGQENAWL